MNSSFAAAPALGERRDENENLPSPNETRSVVIQLSVIVLGQRDVHVANKCEIKWWGQALGQSSTSDPQQSYVSQRFGTRSADQARPWQRLSAEYRKCDDSTDWQQSLQPKALK